VSTIEIDTTQNVSIRFQTANALERILARIIDGFVVATVMYVAFLLVAVGVGFFTTDASESLFPATLTLYVVVFVLGFFYPFIMESIFHGQTLGKMAMNIRVVREDGTEASLGNYAVRFLVGVFEVTLLGIVSVVAVLASKSAQRLGDMAAGTLVVRKPRKVTLAQVGLVMDQPERIIKYHAAGNLSVEDIAIVREVINEAAARQRTPEAIGVILDAARDRIERVLRERSATDSLTFLRDVVDDYNAIHSSPIDITSGTLRRG